MATRGPRRRSKGWGRRVSVVLFFLLSWFPFKSYSHQNIPHCRVTATYGCPHTWRRGAPDDPVRVGVDTLARRRPPSYLRDILKVIQPSAHTSLGGRCSERFPARMATWGPRQSSKGWGRRVGVFPLSYMHDVLQPSDHTSLGGVTATYGFPHTW